MVTVSPAPPYSFPSRFFPVRCHRYQSRTPSFFFLCYFNMPTNGRIYLVFRKPLDRTDESDFVTSNLRRDALAAPPVRIGVGRLIDGP